jgi:hypothetical protein
MRPTKLSSVRLETRRPRKLTLANEEGGELMTRPQFTDTEEKMIGDVLNPSHKPLYIWMQYILWILPSVLLYVLGLLNSKPYPQIVGFVIVLYLLVRYIAFQCKPDWRIILGKYEEAFKDGGQQTSAGDVANRSAPAK